MLYAIKLGFINVRSK